MVKKVLMVVTSHDRLGNTEKSTGLYLSEFAHPYEIFEQAGYEISVASPKGGDAPVDPKSLNDQLEQYITHVQDTLTLAQVEAEDYDIFFVVGGHGTVWDLPDNRELQRIFPKAYDQGKIIAAVCHGPAALVKLKKDNGEFLIQGKNIAGFSNEEESAISLTEVVPFLLEDAIKNAGGNYIDSPKWSKNVVVDERIVTGQNPTSARGVAEAVMALVTGTTETKVVVSAS